MRSLVGSSARHDRSIVRAKILVWQPTLVVCLLLAGATRGSALETLETVVTDAAYKDACGPFSCLVALRLLGADSSLQKVGKECDWTEGKPVGLQAMQQTLDGYAGIECQAVKLTPDELIDVLEDDQAVAILAIRKNSEEIDHSVCAASTDRSKQTIRWIDYPELEQEKALTEVAKVWDGTALVVRWSPTFSIARRFSLLVLPTIALFCLFRIVGRRRA
jgi:hypothetical protein